MTNLTFVHNKFFNEDLPQLSLDDNTDYSYFSSEDTPFDYKLLLLLMSDVSAKTLYHDSYYRSIVEFTINDDIKVYQLYNTTMTSMDDICFYIMKTVDEKKLHQQFPDKDSDSASEYIIHTSHDASISLMPAYLKMTDSLFEKIFNDDNKISIFNILKNVTVSKFDYKNKTMTAIDVNDLPYSILTK